MPLSTTLSLSISELNAPDSSPRRVQHSMRRSSVISSFCCRTIDWRSFAALAINRSRSLVGFLTVTVVRTVLSGAEGGCGATIFVEVPIHVDWDCFCVDCGAVFDCVCDCLVDDDDVDVDVDVDVDAVNNTNANAISGGNSNGGDRTFGTTKWILMGSAATFGIVAVAILFCTGLFSAKRRKKNQNGGEHHHQQQEQHHRQQRGVVGARSINNASSLDSCSCYIQDDYGVGGDYDRDYHCNADDDCWSMSVLSVPQRPKADGNINGNGDDCNNGDRVVDADVDVDVDIEGGGRGEPLQQQQQHCQEEQEHQTQDDPLSRTASF